MRIAFGCDHGGHPLKKLIIAALEHDGHHVLDLGTFSSDPVDYPDFARGVGNAVGNRFVEAGILVCSSGVGAAIAANKIQGVRAAACHDLLTARQSREDDNTNVLCLGVHALNADSAIAIAREWLSIQFSGEERHIRRLAKITELEEEFLSRAAERTVRREPPARLAAKPSEKAAPPEAKPASRPAPPLEEPTSPPKPPVHKEVAAAPERDLATLQPSLADKVPPWEPKPVTPDPSLAAKTTKVEEVPAPPERHLAAAQPSLADKVPPSEPKPVTPDPSLADKTTKVEEVPAPPERDLATLQPSLAKELATLPPSMAEELAKVIEEFDHKTGAVKPAQERPSQAPGRAVPQVPAAASAPPPPPPPAPPPPPHPTPTDQFARAADECVKTLEGRGFIESLWTREASLWTDDGAQQALIRNRLGWLTSPMLMRQHATDLTQFADDMGRQYSHVLLLGMGGATMCPEVLRLTFGRKTGFPDLVLLDSTDPAAVKQVLNRLNIPRTLFVVSSKSGVTVETLAFYAFFREQVERSASGKPGSQFVVITDAGTPLEKLAKGHGFRKVFLNPPTVGGRFSALSYFGLVPAALVGVDVAGLLDRAVLAMQEAGDSVPLRQNPGAMLGAKLAAWGKAGRDKVTLVFSPAIAAFGVWLEQLLAESLGKNEHGLIPVDGEPLGAPTVYGQDRVFVAVTLEEDAGALEGGLAALEQAGHPVIRIRLRDPLDLGAEMYRWEIATATIGALLGVNPFNEPNVQESKDITVKLLTTYRTSRRLPEWPVDREEDGIALLTGTGTKPPTVSEGLAAHLRLARPGDYIGFQIYLPPRPEITETLQELRRVVRDRTKLAVTVGLGPRYLHSTGQLHKGGPRTGLFIQLTADDPQDLAIPGEGYTFSVLKNAQALGDLEALRNKGRRVVRVHLGGRDPIDALKKFTAMLARVVPAA